jgi:hypothetical protein
MKRFLHFMRRKMKLKNGIMPDQANYRSFRKAKTFKEVDDLYTGPVHGFEDAKDYWNKCHSRQFLASITVPTLLITAHDDPFLPEECYPYEEARASRTFHFEVPRYGGHVGFVRFNNDGEYWHETRIAEFASSLVRSG